MKRQPNERFRCRVRGCRRLVAVNVWILPCCAQHAAKLPDRLYVDAFRAAEGSPYDPAAVLRAALVVTKIQGFFGKKGGRRG